MLAVVVAAHVGSIISRGVIFLGFIQTPASTGMELVTVLALLFATGVSLKGVTFTVVAVAVAVTVSFLATAAMDIVVSTLSLTVTGMSVGYFRFKLLT